MSQQSDLGGKRQKKYVNRSPNFWDYIPYEGARLARESATVNAPKSKLDAHLSDPEGREEIGGEKENMAFIKREVDWTVVENPENHDFNKEAMVEGNVIRRATVSISGNERPLIVLDTKDGERTVWLGSVLESGVMDAVVGSYVAIKYVGEVKGKSGYTYKDYLTRVLPPEVEK